MNNIKLLKLKLENFKGIKELVVDFGGENYNVFGDNETGKTTLVDAFMWLLFDKNADGNKAFSIKPIDPETKEEIHNLTTEVEVILSVNDSEMSLRKEYKEKWTKKRGETELEFTGHTTDHFVDETPLKQSEYKNKIDEIVDEETFKMITNVLHFNSGISWKERRDIVLSLAPPTNVEDVLKNNPDLKPLESELNKKSVSDILKTHKGIITQTNKLLDTIPARIDELNKIDFAEIVGIKKEDLQQMILAKEKEQVELTARITSSDNSQEIKNLELKIKELELEKRELENFKSEKADKLSKIKEEGIVLRTKVKEHESDLDSTKSDIAKWLKEVAEWLSEKDKIYEEYDKVEARVFDAGNCNYCGQALPEDKLEEQRSHFNLHKVDELEKWKNKGVEINVRVEELNKRIEAAQTRGEAINSQYETDKLALDAKLKEFAEVEKLEEVNPNLEKIADINSKISSIKTNIEVLKTTKTNDALLEEDQKLKDEVFDLTSKLTKFEEKERTQTRLTELIEEQKKAGKTLEASYKVVRLCELYQVEEINLLEDSINDNFELVEFKMFEKQINGGITETCIATVNGVPFADLNNAMKINAGLDIIRGIQKVKNIKAPVFVDNAESVTKYVDLGDTQIIKLYVSENDKKLRFEKAE